MRNTILKTLLLVCFIATAGYSQNNRELQQMADDDQSARNVANIDWEKLNRADSLRRIRVLELIKSGKVVTGTDHLNAGIIFQHGNDTIASALAVKSFKTALELDGWLNKWWYPAAVDRDLMRRKLPQIYGTQFIKDHTTGEKWRRYTIDTTKVTDEERRYYGVETLAEQELKERLMNQQSISEFYQKTKSISETIEEIKHQFKQGTLSAYNVSEDAVNIFGYELVSKMLYNEALKVFELNTRLYPDAYNTFDSYGELLLKMGRKKEAVKAYKESVMLNPENDNAVKILKSLELKK